MAGYNPPRPLGARWHGLLHEVATSVYQIQIILITYFAEAIKKRPGRDPPLMDGACSVAQAFRPDFLQDGGGDFLDGLGGGREPADASAPHHGFGR